MRRRSVVLGALAAPAASLAGEPSWEELVRLGSDYTDECERLLKGRGVHRLPKRFGGAFAVFTDVKKVGAS